MIRPWAKNMGTWLYGDVLDKSYTTHSFRCLAATALAESGISICALCHAGRWKSMGVAMEYVENTTVEKRERALMLDGESTNAIIVAPKRAKHQGELAEHRGELIERTSGNQPNVVKGNCTVINIASCSGGTISFLNGKLLSNSDE